MQRLTLLSLLTSLLVVACVAGAASADELYVGPGEKYESIQDAVDQAKPGDTIVVKDGRYGEDVDISGFFGRKDNITVVADNPHGAVLQGTIYVLANGVVIDGFALDAEDGGAYYSGVYVLGNNNAFSDAGAIKVSGDQETFGLSFWVPNGTASIGISERGSLTVTTQGNFASGIDVTGSGDWVIDQSGPVAVHADGTTAFGINVYRSPFIGREQANLTISGDGDVRVTAEEGAGGIILGVTAEDPTYPALLPLGRLHLDHGGNVTVIAEAEDSVAAGVAAYAQADNSTVTLRGDIDVEAGAFARGVRLSLGDEAEVVVNGAVTVDAREGGSKGYGVYVSLGDGSEEGGSVTVGGEVTTTGGGEAVGVEMEAGSGTTLTVTKLVDASARDSGSTAIGITISGLDDTVAKVLGDVRASAGSAALGVHVAAGAESGVEIGGAVTVTAGHHAYGLQIVTAEKSAVTVAGKVSAEGGSAAGVQMRVGNGSTVSVEGSVDAKARDERSTATGVYAYLGRGSTFTLDGVLTAEGGADPNNSNIGALLHGGGSNVITVAGSVTVTGNGGGADAIGVGVLGGPGDALNINAPIMVEGGAGAVGVLYGVDGSAVPGPDDRPVVITLSEDIAVKAAGVAGVLVEAHAVEVVNNATIIAHSSSGGGPAYGLMIDDVTEWAAIENTGTIDAGSNGIAISAESDTASVVLTNTGRIIGDVRFGDGDVQVVLRETSDVRGNLDLGRFATGKKHATLYAGTLLDGALLAAGDYSVLTLLPAEKGGGMTRLQKVDFFNEAVVEGGHWVFADEAHIGALNIEKDGHVTLEGRIVGDTVNMNGGLLSGNGSIGSHVHNTAGTVSPGSSFGVLTIGDQGRGGNYTQGVDAELVIEIRPAAAPQAGVDYDQLRVTGKAVFEDGTTVRIVPQAGIYPTGVNYAIVDGEVQFDPEKVNLVFDRAALFLAGQLVEGSLQLVLTPKPFESVAATVGQASVAAALTAVKDRPATQLDEVYAWLFSLEPGDEQLVQHALDTMSGEVYTALPTLASRRLESLVAGVQQGLAQGTEPGRQFWAVAQGNSSRIRDDRGRGTANADLQLAGATVGTDLLQREGARAGFMAGFLTESLAMDDRRSSVKGDSVHVGAYGRWELKPVSLTGVVGVSMGRMDAQRRVVFGSSRRTAQAAFDMTDTVMELDARFYSLSHGSTRLQPFVSVGRYSTHRNGFSEAGAGNEGLTVQSYDAAWIRGRLGFELGSTEPDERGRAWHAHLAWVHDFSVAEREATARFNGAPDRSFTVPGTPVQPNGFEMALGMSGMLRGRVTWGVSYTAEFRGDGDSHAFHAGFGLLF